MDKRLYIICGCNGAGKTTASFTVLPELLGCREFVNADEIARGLSPFNPESVAVEAGRLMLKRIDELLAEGSDFALETTLATRSYVGLVDRAHEQGYRVSLLFFWLRSTELAHERVAERVRRGGHNIAPDVIDRRYRLGLRNLFELFVPIVDEWMLIDNSDENVAVVAKKKVSESIEIKDLITYNKIRNGYNNSH